MSITQAAFDGVCMQNLDLKRQNQAMKEALEGLMNTLKALDEDYDVRHSYVQAEKALTLTNTKGRKS